MSIALAAAAGGAGAGVGLTVIRNAVDVWADNRSESLVDYTQQARVEPLTLVDADVLYWEGTSSVMQTLLALFSGYYLQAVALSATVGRIQVGKHLDRLNPQRNPSQAAASGVGRLLATENYKHRLPTMAKQIGLEDLRDHIPLDVQDWADKKAKQMANPKPSTSEARVSDNVNRELQEVVNLSIGKIFNVEISDAGHKATIPISVRLMASTLSSNSLVHILSLDSEDISLKERYHAYKAGRIEFIRDLVLCQDLISERRKNLLADKEGIYSSIIKRQRQNGLSTMLSGQTSVATASNIVVISDATADQLELKHQLKLSRFSDREKVFKSTYIMLLVVVDKQWNRVSIYTRGINGVTELNAADLKASNRGNGPDVSEILRAFQMGSAPSI